MSQELLSDETSQHQEVQRIIGGLLKFEPESRIRIYKTVGTFFTFDASTESRFSRPSMQNSPDSPSEQRKPRFSRSEEFSPKDFLFEKQPSTDVDRVACLAYFLTHFRATPHFKTVDISNLNTEAAQMKFSNAAYAVANAKQAGLLVEANKGANQLSASGERYIDALPDRVAAREILSSARPKRGRKKGSSNGVKTNE